MQRRGTLGRSALVRFPAALAVLVAVFSSVLVVGTGAPAAQARPQPAPDPPGLEPIVFVHGLHDSTAAFTTMLQRFRDAGVPEDRLWAWGYDSRKSNVDTADDFAAFVTGVRLETGAPRVDVVTHSMGALPTRWCIRFGPCRRVVDDWVSLAGPNHGTNITITCLLFPTEDGCPEMAIGSSFLETLNAGDETPGQVDWTTVRSTADQIITPSSSTELAGAANIVFDGLAHNDLLSDPVVFGKVAAVVFDGTDPRTTAGAPDPATSSAPEAPVGFRDSPDAVGPPAAGPQVAAGAAPVPEAARPAILVTKLDVVPDSRRDIAFSLCRGAEPCRTFTLDDDADPTRSRRHRASGLRAGTHRVIARPPAGWSVTGVTCAPEGQGDPARSRARVGLRAGAKVVCTFTVARTATPPTTSTTSSTTTTPVSTTTTSSTTTTTTAPPPPPANDALATARSLVGATGTSSGENRRATVEPGESEHAETAATRTVWYRWTSGITALLALDTCASGFDTVLAVYAGPATDPTPAALTEVGADDDSCGTGSRVRFASSPGTTYYVVVGGYGGAQGDLVLRRQIVGLPVSDAFAAPVALAPAGGTLDVATTGATAEPAEPAHDGDAAGHSVWFTWTAPADGPVTFSTCGSDHDTVLAVYTGSALGGLTRVAADDDTCELGARTGVVATAGTTYRIAVDGFHGAAGAATLTWG